ncbi:MAG: hypothetical protein J0L66_15945 [Cytophagales bacterium]|nr:hypothetical protein [Cytophagales bacterium]
MYKAVFVAWFILKLSCSCAQGIGSLQDYWSKKNDSRLVSLRFNGRIYAPRPGTLPKEKYDAKYLDSEQYFNHVYQFRPVELFVSEDGGTNWKLASFSLFELINSSNIKTELSLVNETAKMHKINENHFVLTSLITIETSGSLKRNNYPIIYVFKENIRDGYLNIEDVQVFRPEEINNNRIIEIVTVGTKTTFRFNNGDTATFTFNPNDKVESEYSDSRGNFSTRWKNR